MRRYLCKAKSWKTKETIPGTFAWEWVLGQQWGSLPSNHVQTAIKLHFTLTETRNCCSMFHCSAIIFFVLTLTWEYIAHSSQVFFTLSSGSLHCVQLILGPNCCVPKRITAHATWITKTNNKGSQFNNAYIKERKKTPQTEFWEVEDPIGLYMYVLYI